MCTNPYFYSNLDVNIVNIERCSPVGRSLDSLNVGPSDEEILDQTYHYV